MSSEDLFPLRAASAKFPGIAQLPGRLAETGVRSVRTCVQLALKGDKGKTMVVFSLGLFHGDRKDEGDDTVEP